MHVAQNWRMMGTRYALKGIRCQNCQKVIFPPRDVCPHCDARKNENEIVAFNAPVYERAAR